MRAGEAPIQSRGPIGEAILTGVATLLLAFVAFRMTFLLGPNADIWFVASLARDIRLGIPVSGWTFPPPIFLFPEILPALALALVFSPAIYLAIYAAGTMLATALLLWLLARKLSTDNRAALGPLVAMLLLLVAAVLPLPRFDTLALLLWPFIHYSSIFTALILLLVTISRLTTPPTRKSFAALAACYFVLVTGDILALEQFAAPMFATLAVLAFARVIRPAVLLSHLGAFAVAFVLFTLAKFLGHYYFAFDFPKASDWLPNLTRLGRYLLEAWRTFRPIMAEYWLLLAIGFVWAVVSFRLIRRFVRDRPGPPDPKVAIGVLFFVVFMLMAFGVSLVVPIVYGNASYQTQLRYFTPVLVLPSIALAVLLAGARGHHVKWMRRGLACIAIGAGLFSIFRFQLWRLDERALFSAWEYEALSSLDEACNSRSVRYGYDCYWFCKLTSVGSSAGVCPQQIKSDFTPFVHIANKRWFSNPDGTFSPGEFPAYSFVLIGPYREPAFTRESIAARFGPAAAEIQVHPSLQVLFYDRPEDIAFRNYLRSPAAALMEQRVGPSRVLPSTIEQFVPEVEANSVAVGRKLDVRFDPPASGDVLELTCSPDAELVLHAFDAADRPVCRIESNPDTLGPRRFHSIRTAARGDGAGTPPTPVARISIESSKPSSQIAYLTVYPDTRRFK